MNTIGGCVCIRNGTAYDFCWQEAVRSLLPVCDEVVVCEAQSTDDTRQILNEWAKTEPKIKVCEYAWPDPKGDIDFWVKWLNFGREHLRSHYHFQLDADEVLHENSYDELRRGAEKPDTVLMCDRFNFYKDAQHLIPPGHCCSHKVNRFAPAHYFMSSDGQHETPVNRQGAILGHLAAPSTIQICHYGFLRYPKAFFDKARALQGAFFNSYDERLARAEPEGDEWMTRIQGVDWIDHLTPFTGTHPEIIKPWLAERGYHV